MPKISELSLLSALLVVDEEERDWSTQFYVVTDQGQNYEEGDEDENG